MISITPSRLRRGTTPLQRLKVENDCTDLFKKKQHSSSPPGHIPEEQTQSEQQANVVNIEPDHHVPRKTISPYVLQGSDTRVGGGGEGGEGKVFPMCGGGLSALSDYKTRSVGHCYHASAGQ